jgi:hypothetical protein
MNKAQKVLITAGVAIVVVLVLYVIASAITKTTGYVVSEPEDPFANCLEEQDITLYINTEEPEQTLRNSLVINYLDNIKIMNCQRNPEVCQDMGIVTFPTWLINDKIIAGELSLGELSQYSGCEQ